MNEMLVRFSFWFGLFIFGSISLVVAGPKNLPRQNSSEWIVIQSEKTGSRQTIRGQILDFDGE